MKDSYSKKEVNLLMVNMKKKYIKTLKCYQSKTDFTSDDFDKGYERGVDNCIAALEEMDGDKELS